MFFSKKIGDFSEAKKRRFLKRKDKKFFFNLVGKSYKKGDPAIAFAFITPAVILGIIFTILPMVISLAYAFTDAYMLDLS